MAIPPHLIPRPIPYGYNKGLVPSLSSLPRAHYADVIVQLVFSTLTDSSPQHPCLVVWDGSDWDHEKSPLIALDDDCNVTEVIPADPALKERAKGRTITVFCYDYDRQIQQPIKSGDWIYLQNVHVGYKTGSRFSQFIMHDNTAYRTRHIWKLEGPTRGLFYEKEWKAAMARAASVPVLSPTEIEAHRRARGMPGSFDASPALPPLVPSPAIPSRAPADTSAASTAVPATTQPSPRPAPVVRIAVDDEPPQATRRATATAQKEAKRKEKEKKKIRKSLKKKLMEKVERRMLNQGLGVPDREDLDAIATTVAKAVKAKIEEKRRAAAPTATRTTGAATVPIAVVTTSPSSPRVSTPAPIARRAKTEAAGSTSAGMTATLSPRKRLAAIEADAKRRIHD